MRVAAAIVLVGCSSSGSPRDAAPAYTQTLPSGPCAVEGVTGAVAGVTLAIRSSSCVYPRGTAAHFTYEVTTSGVPPLDVPSSTGCGPCVRPSAEPMSWLRWRVEGMSPAGEYQRYCLCDTGCCPPLQTSTIQVSSTTQSATIDWSGRVWDGPSDTGNPEGDYFAPGRYAVVVTFAGFEAGEVRAELPIEVISP